MSTQFTEWEEWDQGQDVLTDLGGTQEGIPSVPRFCPSPTYSYDPTVFGSIIDDVEHP